jgi:hypothetical protein
MFSLAGAILEHGHQVDQEGGGEEGPVGNP